MTHGRRIAPLLAALLLAVLSLAATAAPDARAATTVAVTSDASSVLEGVAPTITVAGHADSLLLLYVYVEPTGKPCGTGPNYWDNYGVYPTYNGNNVNGDFSRSTRVNLGPTGDVTICAFLEDSWTSTVVARAQTTITVRRPTATIGLSGLDDPTEGITMGLTVSGRTEDKARVYLQAAGPRGCATYPNGNLYSGTSINTADHPWVGPGDYSWSTVWAPPGPGHYTLCAYVTDDNLEPAYALKTFEVDARRTRATLHIEPAKTEYLNNENVTALVSGYVEAGSGLHTQTVAGPACPDPSVTSAVFGSPVAGNISEPVTADPQTADSYSICATVTRGDVVYASAEAHLHKLALPAATAEPGMPAGKIATRTPTFAWSALAGVDDDLVLLDREGNQLMLVGSDGAWVPSGGENQGGDTLKKPANVRKGYDRVPGVATYTSAGGRVAVKLKQPLPPGSYRWTIVRTRSDGARAVTGPVAFKVAGPDVSRLKVRARAFFASTSRHPGHSELQITTTPYAYVRIALSRGGRQQVQNVRWDSNRTHSLTYNWTCRATGGSYRYAITASDDSGHSFTRRGTLRTISHARCAALRRAERRRVGQRVAARRRAEAQAEARREAAARRRLQKLVDQCHSVDGVVRTWEWSDGSESLLCVTPYGSYLM